MKILFMQYENKKIYTLCVYIIIVFRLYIVCEYNLGAYLTLKYDLEISLSTYDKKP